MRATNLAAYSHQEMPFERLVEVINPARSLARHPLFQVMLALQNNVAVRLELPGLRSAFEPVATASAKFDLSVSLSEQRAADGTPAGIAGVAGIRHRPVRACERGGDDGAADPAAGGGGCGCPTGRSAASTFSAAEERRTILRDWNDTARAVPSATLPELFAAQVDDDA